LGEEKYSTRAFFAASFLSGGCAPPLNVFTDMEWLLLVPKSHITKKKTVLDIIQK
jgi:hypothetical protein